MGLFDFITSGSDAKTTDEYMRSLGFDPTLDRANILPVAGSRSEGNLEFAAPQAVYGLLESLAAPAIAARGGDVSPEKLQEAAMNTMGAGTFASGLLGAVPEGSLGANVYPRKVRPFAERMKSARDMRFDTEVPVYHASTEDIGESIKMSKLNPESDQGAALYTSTSYEDAAANYARLEAQDLTAKIEDMASRIESEKDIPYEEALKEATKKLYGEAPNVNKFLGKMENPVVIGSDDNTFIDIARREFDPEDYMDEASNNVYREDYDSSADYEDALRDAAEDLAYEDSYNFEPEGPLADAIDYLRRNEYGADFSEAIHELSVSAMEEGGVDADDFLRIVKNDPEGMYAEDEAGRLIINEIARKALESAGYDGIIDRGVNKKWGTESGRRTPMEGINEDTEHRIFFKPENIRSINAEFDPSKMGENNLLSYVLGSNYTGAA